MLVACVIEVEAGGPAGCKTSVITAAARVSTNAAVATENAKKSSAPFRVFRFLGFSISGPFDLVLARGIACLIPALVFDGRLRTCVLRNGSGPELK